MAQVEKAEDAKVGDYIETEVELSGPQLVINDLMTEVSQLAGQRAEARANVVLCQRNLKKKLKELDDYIKLVARLKLAYKEVAGEEWDPTKASKEAEKAE